MRLSGSCDAETFAVNIGSETPYRSGIITTERLREHQVKEGWVVRVTTPYVRLWNQGEFGNVVLWDYHRDIASPDPYFWVVHDSSFALTHTWESEQHPDTVVNRGTSPIVFDTPLDTVPSGGGSIQAYLPLHSELETIETSVSGASTPTWITNTLFEDAPNMISLISKLFLYKQNERRMQPYYDLAAIKNLFLDSKVYSWYYLLWLRSASQILYNHRSETMIPLVKDLCQIDSSTGILSLI